MIEGRVYSINVSEKKGTRKRRVEEAFAKEGFGIVGDAHAGPWHRQVSLLSIEMIRSFGPFEPGDFAENITTEGVDLRRLKVGDRVEVGEAVLIVTQKGKECHDSCEIKRLVGRCVMPKEGVFARVLKGGRIKVGDRVRCFDE